MIVSPAGATPLTKPSGFHTGPLRRTASGAAAAAPCTGFKLPVSGESSRNSPSSPFAHRPGNRYSIAWRTDVQTRRRRAVAIARRGRIVVDGSMGTLIHIGCHDVFCVFPSIPPARQGRRSLILLNGRKLETRNVYPPSFRPSADLARLPGLRLSVCVSECHFVLLYLRHSTVNLHGSDKGRFLG